jgi:predicted peroxiredoxin
MMRRLLIVFTNADLKAPQTLSAPFYHAALAAAMDYEVDVFCSGAAAQLMVKRVAQSLAVTAKDAKTVYDWIKEAHDQGARFWTCSTNLELIGASDKDLIPECKGMMSAAIMLRDVMEGECRVLSY